ncbi:protein cramped-like [Conger conger]|uniref:protein cramped-like n=1 Tax=Conger conger TaxID=82655 RepID=UPI002A5A9083|nr:protein cramped-like [Conger conger]
MVRRKKTPSAPEEHQNGMTVKQGDGSGDEGVKKLSRKLEGCEEEESADQGSEESNTKRNGDEIPNPSSTGSSSSAPIPSTSSSNPPGPNVSSNQDTSTPVPQSQDQHHFLRSSVRPPSKRLRKDPIASAINGHSGVKGKGTENGPPAPAGCAQSGSPGGSSGGASKSGPRSLGAGEKDEAGSSQKKVRRQWESWSTEDKNTFFQGLYEHGKDFEAIQNNIALKYKKKGKPASMVKNKEQVRHFYYRTWHKISKYIDFSNAYSRVLKKSSQELYGLICYAELRKKVGGLMDDKNVAKLNELIQHGATTVRSKGRNLRIKVPMCRALKKLCDPDGVSDEEDQKPVRLPLKVPMELQPRSNHSWARVQSLAHNPRLRMMVELHRKVSSLIEFLKQKWAIQDHRIWKSLEERDALEGQQHSPWGQEREELFLYPAESSTLTPLPGVARVVHSKAFCTVHWLESGKCRSGGRDLPAAHMLGIQAAPRGLGKQGRAGGAEVRRAEGPAPEAADDASTGKADDKAPGSLNPPNPPQNSLAALPPHAPGQKEGSAPGLTEGAPPLPQLERRSGPGEESTGGSSGTGDASGPGLASRVKEGPCTEVVLSPKNDPPDSSGDGGGGCAEDRTKGSGLSLEGPADVSESPPPPVPAPPPGDTCTKEDRPPEDPGGPEAGRGSRRAGGKEDAGAASGRPPQQIREEGWCARSTENVTLAELYLMLGKPGKLQLEYEWLPVSQEEGRPHPSPRPRPNTHRVLRCLLRLVSSEVNPKPAAELCSTATSPLKPGSEEQSVTPPGKSMTLGVRSPSCGRHQGSIRGGIRNLPRSLLASGDTDSSLFAVPTTLPPNSRHGKMFSPNKEAELAFRQQLHSFSMQSDLFLPKQRKVRNRHLRKPLVVQRTLLPRTTGDSSQHVCSFSILSNSSIAGTGSFRPLQPSMQATSRPVLPKATPQTSATASQLSSAIDLAAKSAGIIPGSPSHEPEGPGAVGLLLAPDAVTPEPKRDHLPQTPAAVVPAEVTLDNGLSPLSPAGDTDTLLSPPSVASLLDISLPGPPEEALSQGETATHISDSIIELAINSSTHSYGDSSSLSPAKLNGSEGPRSLPSPACSPQRSWIASPSHDPQWYPNESSDSTLSCLLSSLISPEKGRKMLTPSGPSSGTSLLGPSLLDSSSRDSFHSRGLPDVGEVDSQLACMMSESSVDYIARFNDLAHELSVSEPPPPPSAGQGGSG